MELVLRLIGAVIVFAQTVWAQFKDLKPIEQVGWVVGTLGPLLGLFWGLRKLFPHKSKAPHAALTRAAFDKLPEPRAGTLNVLVFDLTDDDDRATLTEQLVTALDETYANEANVRRARYVIPLPEMEKTVERERAAWNLVGEALKSCAFEAAVWGRVAPGRNTIFPIVQGRDQKPPEKAAAGYDLLPGLQIPANAIAGIGPLIGLKVATESTQPSASGGSGNSVIDTYRAALKKQDRDADAALWAKTQSSLGVALYTIGKRDENATLIREAVAAYREVLSSLPKDDLLWAATQNNLGIALQTLGEIDGDTACIEEAISAYGEALSVWTPDTKPLEWAATQNSLATALRTLGEQRGDVETLDQAVVAYREALKQRTRDRAPLDWATTQDNLGNVLATLGQREDGTRRLDEAVQAHEHALEVRTRERAPFHWATTLGNLASVEETYGDKTGDLAKYRAAIAHGEAALEVFRSARATQQVAVVETNLARLRTKIEV